MVTGLDDEGLALRAAREGVQDYVLKGSAGMRSLVRVDSLLPSSGTGPWWWPRPRTRAHRQGRILGFVGAKGGAGATTVALNVAAVLARQRKSVIALELRSRFGTFSFQSRWCPLAV